MPREWTWKAEDITPTGMGEVAYQRAQVEALRAIAEELEGMAEELRNLRLVVTRIAPARDETRFLFAPDDV